MSRYTQTRPLWAHGASTPGGRLDPHGALDRRAALELQREMLLQKAVRTEALIASVERAINAERTGVRMTKEEMFEVFGDFDPAEYEDEVQERWGGRPTPTRSRRAAPPSTPRPTGSGSRPRASGSVPIRPG